MYGAHESIPWETRGHQKILKERMLNLPDFFILVLAPGSDRCSVILRLAENSLMHGEIGDALRDKVTKPQRFQ